MTIKYSDIIRINAEDPQNQKRLETILSDFEKTERGQWALENIKKNRISPLPDQFQIGIADSNKELNEFANNLGKTSNMKSHTKFLQPEFDNDIVIQIGREAYRSNGQVDSNNKYNNEDPSSSLKCNVSIFDSLI